MELLQQIIPILVPLSLGALVLALGLDATADDLLFMLRRPALLGRAFLAISVVVPLAAVLVVTILPLQTVTKAGVILMALAPVPPLVPGKDLKLGGRKSYVYGLYFAFALLSVVIVPITVFLLDMAYHRDFIGTGGQLIKTVLISVLLPLAIGFGVRALAPRLAATLSPWVSRLAMVLLVVAFVPIVIKVWGPMVSLIGDGTLLAVTFITICALTAGRLLGGSEYADRVALAGAAATRHPGIAMMLASANFEDKRVVAAVLLYMLVSMVVVMAYQVWLKRRTRSAVATSVPGGAKAP